MRGIQSPGTLIIRFWHEAAEPGRQVVRGSIEHVQSGERIYFQTYGDLKSKLVEFMEDQLLPVNATLSEKGEFE